MGCATFIPKLSTFTKIDQKAVQDVLEVHAEVKEEGTGKYFLFKYLDWQFRQKAEIKYDGY